MAHLGRKEAKCMVCQGCWHGLPHLDPQADISAIWVVGPQTTREEIGEVTRVPTLWPKWMEELTADIVSSLKDCLRQKEGQPPGDLEGPGLADAQPSRSKTPQRRRRGTSAERDLTEVREAHQRALATAATLEKIERLSQSITRDWPDACTHSWSHDHCRRRSHRWNRRCCRVWLEESPALPSEYSPPQWGPGSQEEEEAGPPFLDFNLELLLELGPNVNCFLQEPAGSAEEDDGNSSSPEPQWKSMRDGWPGKHRCTIHLTGGHSWQRSQKWTTTRG